MAVVPGREMDAPTGSLGRLVMGIVISVLMAGVSFAMFAALKAAQGRTICENYAEGGRAVVPGENITFSDKMEGR